MLTVDVRQVNLAKLRAQTESPEQSLNVAVERHADQPGGWLILQDVVVRPRDDLTWAFAYPPAGDRFLIPCYRYEMSDPSSWERPMILGMTFAAAALELARYRVRHLNNPEPFQQMLIVIDEIGPTPTGGRVAYIGVAFRGEAIVKA